MEPSNTDVEEKLLKKYLNAGFSCFMNEEFLKAGFGVVGTHVQDGIARGTGTLVALNNYDASKRLVSNKVTNHFAFTRSAITAQSYPSSLMGMMALVRQMYYDMDWYKKGIILFSKYCTYTK